MHLPPRSALALFILVTLASCERVVDRQPPGDVLAVAGTATIQDRPAAATALTEKSRLGPSVEIATGPGGQASLLLLPGLLVELSGGTTIDLLDSHFAKDGDDASAATTRVRTARLQLVRGKLTVFVLPTQNRRADYWLEVERGASTFRGAGGTLFQVRAASAGISVACAQGSVTLDPGAAIILQAGHRFDWSGGPVSAQAFSPVEIPPRELSSILVAGYRLQQLQLRLRNAVPTWRRVTYEGAHN